VCCITNPKVLAQHPDTIRVQYSNSSYFSQKSKPIVYELVEFIPINGQRYQRLYKTITCTTDSSGNDKCDTLSVCKFLNLDTALVAKIKDRALDTACVQFDVNTLKEYAVRTSRKKVKQLSRQLFARHKIYTMPDAADIDSIIALAYFDKYLLVKNKFRNVIVLDYTNALYLDFNNSDQNVNLHFDFAISKMPETKVYVSGADSGFWKIFNPSILFDLQQYLPRKSRIKNYFSIDNLLLDYIEWYSENSLEFQRQYLEQLMEKK
jgi:hypothetical protein